MKFSSGTYEKLIELDDVQHWHIREINKVYRERSQRSMTPRFLGYTHLTLKKNIWEEIAKEMNMKNVNFNTPFDNWSLSWKLLFMYTDNILIGVGVRIEPIYGAFSEPFWSFGL